MAGSSMVKTGCRLYVRAMPEDVAPEESKRFFFEKKKQKTFANGPQALHQHGLKDQKFFCFFFFKKRSSYLATFAC
jgi:hypothetical protein